jgi:hypothetical protein
MHGSKEPKRVVAAVVMSSGRPLIAQRCPEDPLALEWEFLWGKLEAGACDEAALEREPLEGFRVRATIGAFVAASDHDFGGELLRILAYRVERAVGPCDLLGDPG